jgi:hypothetical protein
MLPIRNRRLPAPSASRRARPRLEALENRCVPATFTVVNTLASGPGSLAQAIADSNQTPGANLIQFDIADAGQQTIRLPVYLPRITNSVTIDGFSQPGSSPSTLAQGDNAVTNIVLDGEGTASGLVVEAADVTVQGLTIQNFAFTAITSYAANTVIQGNFILNNKEGVVVGGLNALVGGTTPDARNVISANQEDGILVWNCDNSASLYATIENNFIGTDATGTVADTNWHQQGGIWQQNGVDLQTCNNVVTHNVISGNGLDGVNIGADHNTISANLVGTDVTGTKVLGNGYFGVEIEGSYNYIGGGNILSGNAYAGVGTTSSDSSTNTIQGDYIGTDATGQLNLGNGQWGVFIYGPNNVFGGPDPGQGNVIAFNGQYGVYIYASSPAAPPTTGAWTYGNLIEANSIFANGQYGVYIFAAPSLAGPPTAGAWTYGNLIEANSIFANGGLGIALVGNANNGAAAPQLTSAVREGNSYVVSGTLQAPPGTYTLEFFANPDASVEGKTFLGRITVTGQASFSVALPALPGVFITATATDAGNNTSQFSNSMPITVTSPSSPNGSADRGERGDAGPDSGDDASHNASADGGNRGGAGTVSGDDASHNGIHDAGQSSAVTDAQGRSGEATARSDRVAPVSVSHVNADGAVARDGPARHPREGLDPDRRAGTAARRGADWPRCLYDGRHI